MATKAKQPNSKPNSKPTTKAARKPRRDIAGIVGALSPADLDAIAAERSGGRPWAEVFAQRGLPGAVLIPLRRRLAQHAPGAPIKARSAQALGRKLAAEREATGQSWARLAARASVSEREARGLVAAAGGPAAGRVYVKREREEA